MSNPYKFEAFICDKCGQEGEMQNPPATLEDGWTREPDADEFGDLIFCPACSPTEGTDNGG